LTDKLEIAITFVKRFFMNFSQSALSFTILPYQEGVKPPVTKPNPAFLTEITEDGMRDLFKRFYSSLYSSPIQDLFP